MRQQQRQLLDRAAAAALLARKLERNIEMTTERLQTHAMSAALFPTVELSAHETDLLPQAADDSGRALRRDLDHRRHDFEHTAVEIERTAGRQLHRLVRTLEQRPDDEARRRLP